MNNYEDEAPRHKKKAKEAKREFDPATRTLPCYKLPDGFFTKYIEEVSE